MEIQIQYFHVNFKNPFPMIKSTFNDISFLEVFNWITFHNQSEDYVEIIYTPHDGKVKHARNIQIAWQR